MTEPVRMTDDDVTILMLHGEQSPEGKAALARLVRQLTDWVDEQVAAEVYGDLRSAGILPAQCSAALHVTGSRCVLDQGHRGPCLCLDDAARGLDHTFVFPSGIADTPVHGTNRNGAVDTQGTGEATNPKDTQQAQSRTGQAAGLAVGTDDHQRGDGASLAGADGVGGDRADPPGGDV